MHGRRCARIGPARGETRCRAVGPACAVGRCGRKTGKCRGEEKNGELGRPAKRREMGFAAGRAGQKLVRGSESESFFFLFLFFF